MFLWMPILSCLFLASSSLHQSRSKASLITGTSKSFRRRYMTSSSSDDRGVQLPSDDSEGSGEIKSWYERIDLAIAKSRRIKGGNYVQIATVDEDSKPHCRTVVFRGFLPVENGLKAMKMITDTRSEKVQQIESSPACEMVWWFSQSSEQFRISGRLQLVTEATEDLRLQEARLAQWKSLSDPAREQFFWKRPGIEYDGIPEVPLGGRDSNGAILTPSENFALLLLYPESVKYLRLRDNLAITDTLRPLDFYWSSTRVNP